MMDTPERLPATQRPIFIVGAPRSGTTLLRQILDAHPNICCPNWETGVFDSLSTMINGDYAKYHANDESFPIHRQGLVEWMRRCTDDLMHQLIQKTGKPRWAEKTPAHVFQMGLIHEAYPDAQFIHIVRDGREVIRSLQNMPWAPRQIRWSARRWVDSVVAGRNHGESLPKGLYLEIRYEDLIRTPRDTITSMCHFLNEAFHSHMLAFNEPSNNSWGKALKPLQNAPVNSYPRLKWHEKLVVWQVAFPLLRQLGYR